MAKIIPQGTNLLLKPIEEEKVRKSGIIVQVNSEKDNPQMGEVVSVGSGITDFKEGDKIVHKKYAGDELTVDGTDYLIISEEEVLAIYEDE